MSFLIEDILKKDFSCSEKKPFKKQLVSDKHQFKREDYEKDSKRLHSCSILQQTLLNKINPYYSQVYDCSSERPYTGVVNCDKTYLPPSYLEYYVASGEFN